MKTILVTGGAGFIGSHTVVELQQSGYDVVIADNLYNSDIEVLDKIEEITGKKPHFIKVDLSKTKECNLVFETYNIDGIINFAAFKAVGESCSMPIEYYKNNMNILLNLLDNMKRRDINYIVHSSSCTVYGEPDSLPIKEESPTKKAESPYGNTKQMAEEVLSFVVQATDINAIALRYFNPIGAHSSAKIGELPRGVPNNLMPFITQTAIGKRKELVVFGDDYPTKDGTCIRDYIHVVDLAKAHIVALNRLFENKNKKPLEFFNIGTGNGFSVLDVIKSFEKTSNTKLNYKIGPRRKGDVIEIWADTSFAEKLLGWKAQKTLDEMTLSAWNWEKALSKK
ncbi:MAG: UDP-glucose 4-epimerase GalE [Bacteroidales bacterium]|jgi:UDP-glucose 4-epimerase|nr:UDP-glucose 4-epimerase GalE [Bacteroidales bacterium]